MITFQSKLMEYTKDLLEKIKKLAKDLTPIEELAALLDVSEMELRQDINTPEHAARRAYMSGYAETSLRLRRMNIDLVNAGSPAADEACRQYLKRMTRDIDI